MWYEILVPSSILIFLTSCPSLILPHVNKWQLGNVFNRYTDDRVVEHWWFRDHHLTGNPYKPNGIDTLSDEPPEQYRKKE